MTTTAKQETEPHTYDHIPVCVVADGVCVACMRKAGTAWVRVAGIAGWTFGPACAGCALEVAWRHELRGKVVELLAVAATS